MKFKLPINATVDKWFLNYILRHTEGNQSHQSEKRTSFWFTRPFRLQLSEVLCRSSGNCVGQRRKSYLETQKVRRLLMKMLMLLTQFLTIFTVELRMM